MNDTIRHDKDGGFTVIPEKVMKPLKFKEAAIKNTDIMYSAISRISYNLNSRLETFVIEGLKRKGFEFNNKSELVNFIEHRCKREDNTYLKQITYFIDNEPFFLHDYNIKMDLTTIIDGKNTTIIASYGNFAYL